MKKCVKSFATVAALMLLPTSVCLEWFFTNQEKKLSKTTVKWLFFTVLLF